ncbi:MAG: hypothetical protein ABI140_21035 [Jatrophihabitantaceae bacterium]
MIGYGRTSDQEMSEAPNLIVEKKGSVLTARIREVCRTCNNGWMSRLETVAQPLLERLWAPTYAFGRTALDVDEAALVATWATKTAWERERTSDQAVTATEEMRRHPMDQQLPPEFTSVWIARHQGRTNFGVFVARVEATHQDDHWSTDRRRHVLMCVMTFRGLSVLVRTDDGWGVAQMELPESHWRKMWPVSGPIRWPPPMAVSDEDVQAVAMRHSWLRHPDVPIFVRDRRGFQRCPLRARAVRGRLARESGLTGRDHSWRVSNGLITEV